WSAKPCRYVVSAGRTPSVEGGFAIGSIGCCRIRRPVRVFPKRGLPMAPAYKRILLKVSGEALAGDNSFGIEPPFLQKVAKQIADVANSGVEVAIVVGGGNIFRGMTGAADGTDRVTADMMGMLGTMINALALSNAISGQGRKSKPYSA